MPSARRRRAEAGRAPSCEQRGPSRLRPGAGHGVAWRTRRVPAGPAPTPPLRQRGARSTHGAELSLELPPMTLSCPPMTRVTELPPMGPATRLGAAVCGAAPSPGRMRVRLRRAGCAAVTGAALHDHRLRA
jgi:hypothetical protein